METMLPLSINNLSPNPAGAGQPPAESAGGEDFLRVLARYTGDTSGDKAASGDWELENPDSAALTSLLAALASNYPAIFSREGEPPPGQGLSILKEDSPSGALPELLAFARDPNPPRIEKETPLSLPSPGPSVEVAAPFAPLLPSGGGKEDEGPGEMSRLRASIPSSVPSAKGEAPLLPEENKPVERTSGAVPSAPSPTPSAVPFGQEEQAGRQNAAGPGQSPAPGADLPMEGRPVRPEDKESVFAARTGPGRLESPGLKKERDGITGGHDLTNGRTSSPAGGTEGKPPAAALAGGNQGSPYLPREERVSGKPAASAAKIEPSPATGGEKHPPSEEGPIPGLTTQPSFPRNMEWGVLSRGGEEGEGPQLPGGRNIQTHSAGKEAQALPGSYGASWASTPSSFGFVEKAEGAEAFAQPRVVPPAVSQQVGEKVLWLIRNQEEKIGISLDPPELGHLYLEIHRTRENIQTTLWTDNPLTKATLESGQLDIQKIVESEGFKLEKFDVLVQQDLGRQERRESFVPPNPREASASAGTDAPVHAVPDSILRSPSRPHRGSRQLDLFV